jgi:hypothetical protein
VSKEKKRKVIAVDLDRTLAKYDTWRGIEHIGEPIELTLRRVHRALELGHEVRVFTARADKSRADYLQAIEHIKQWWHKHISTVATPVISNEKQLDVDEIWDDIAVGVVANTGEFRSPTRIILS